MGTVLDLANATKAAFANGEIDANGDGNVSAYELNEFFSEQAILTGQLDETQIWNLSVSVIETITGKDAGKFGEIPTEDAGEGATISLDQVDDVVDVFAKLDTNNCGNHDNNEIGNVLAGLNPGDEVVDLNEAVGNGVPTPGIIPGAT